MAAKRSELEPNQATRKSMPEIYDRWAEGLMKVAFITFLSSSFTFWGSQLYRLYSRENFGNRNQPITASVKREESDNKMAENENSLVPKGESRVAKEESNSKLQHQKTTKEKTSDRGSKQSKGKGSRQQNLFETFKALPLFDKVMAIVSAVSMFFMTIITWLGVVSGRVKENFEDIDDSAKVKN